MPAGVARCIATIDAVRDIQVGDTKAVGNAIFTQAACNLGAPTEKTERTSFSQQAAARTPAAFIGEDVHNASDSVRAIERRTRAPQHFEPVDVCDDQIAKQSRPVALRRSYIAQPLTVNEDGRVLVSEAARLERSERPGAAELLIAQSCGRSQCFGNGELVTCLNLLPADCANRFGNLLSSLGAACGCDDDLLGNASQLERDVQNQGATRFQLKKLSGRSGETFGFSFDDIFAWSKSRETDTSPGNRTWHSVVRRSHEHRA